MKTTEFATDTEKGNSGFHLDKWTEALKMALMMVLSMGKASCLRAQVLQTHLSH